MKSSPKISSAYLKEVNMLGSIDLVYALVGHGLFAEKIPPFLTGEHFVNFMQANDFPFNKNKGTDYIRYHNMRNINVPRTIGIPNPFSYYSQVDHVANNWASFLEHFARYTSAWIYKVSRIHLRKLKDKPYLFEMNYKNPSTDGFPVDRLVIKSKFKVEADIANCFGSIYSHSIPWALLGKKESKVEKDNKRHWCNILDKYTRNTKSEETNGLLIGPHMSNLLSETILVVVDDLLLSKGYRFIRNIDDYECYVSSYEEAERFILDLSQSLKTFELQLNSKKTKIEPLPNVSTTHWVNRLNNFHISETVKNEKTVFPHKRLRSFLDLAIELTLEYKDAAVLKYAIKLISGKHLEWGAREYLLNKVHHLVLHYPYLCQIIDDKIFIPFETSASRIREISNDLLELGDTKKTYEASSYGLYFALKYHFDIPNINIENILDSNDCIYMLLGFLYFKERNDETNINRFKKKARDLQDDDINRYWVFVYEVLPITEISGDFKAIKKANVSFIDYSFQRPKETSSNLNLYGSLHAILDHEYES